MATLKNSISDRARQVYARQLMSTRRQNQLAEFPLTRGIAKRKARKLFDICAGFVYSQILKACVELDLFTLLADTPMAARDIAAKLDLLGDRTERLCDAAVALDLLDRRSDGTYIVGEMGASVIGCPGLVEMVRHHDIFYDDLRDPVALLRDGEGNTELSRYWTYAAGDAPAGLDAEAVSSYSDLMAATVPPIAEEVLGAYGFTSDDRLLDIGGGNGAFASIVARRTPHLSVSTFDLPAVSALARARFVADGLTERADVHEGDFLSDALPSGADVISLVRVLIDLNDGAALGLLRRVRDALPRGGTIVVAEHMSDARGAEPAGDAYFGLYLLAMGRGRPRTPKQICSLLNRAGFTAVRTIGSARPVFAQVVLGRRKEEESAHEE
ncbi:MAG: methyltransferase [Pseudomonadota bacterium]